MTELGMKFNILGRGEELIGHWALNDPAIDEISKTSEWINNRETTARVTVNGVELSFAALDKMLLEVYEQHLKKAEEKYADLDAEVDRRLKQRLKDEAEPIIDSLYKLAGALSDVDAAIVPYWNKKEKNDV